MERATYDSPAAAAKRMQRMRAKQKAAGISLVQISLPAREKAILESIAVIDKRAEKDVILDIVRAGLLALQGKTLQLALGEFDRAS